VARLAWVYILKCSDGSYYTGWTWDPEKRTRVHNAGRGSKYVDGRRPATLIYVEALASQRLAMKRERAIKKMTRKRKEKLIGRFWEQAV
jgi:putative endonuclease